MSILRSKHFSQIQQIPLYTNPTNSLSQTQKFAFTNPLYPFSNLSKHPKQIQQTQDRLQIQPQDRGRVRWENEEGEDSHSIPYGLQIYLETHTTHYTQPKNWPTTCKHYRSQISPLLANGPHHTDDLEERKK